MSNLPANQHQSEANQVGWRCCSPFIPYLDNTFLIDLLTGEFRH